MKKPNSRCFGLLSTPLSLGGLMAVAIAGHFRDLYFAVKAQK
ncbi:hypothetical protein PY546_20775 [Providencia stuartii]|nr:hypothetical protein [Providencia stuartii]